MERRRKRLASRGYVGGGPLGWMYGVRDDDDRDDLTMTGFGGHLGAQFDGLDGDGGGDDGDGGGDGGGGGGE